MVDKSLILCITSYHGNHHIIIIIIYRIRLRRQRGRVL